MRWNQVAVPIVVALFGCADDPFSPEEVAGYYPLASVDGYDVGWYHDVGGADCQVAFVAGGLEIQASGEFDFDVDYDVRCFGVDPFDAAGYLHVFGDRTREEDGILLLEGWGPDLINPVYSDRWTLQVERSGDHLTLRFVGFAREWWGDPILGLGPRNDLGQG